MQASAVDLGMHRSGSTNPSPLPQPSRRTSKLQSVAPGTLSSLLVPRVFGKPIGRSGASVTQDTRGMIPSVPSRADSQASLLSPTSLGQVKAGRYRSGTSPLVSHTSGRPMQWGFSNAVSSAATTMPDRPKQTFELPTLIKNAAGPLGSSRGAQGSGLGRTQQPAQYIPTANLPSHNSRHLLGRQY